MRWTLAIETSTRDGGIALFHNDNLEQLQRFRPDQPASEYLVPAIDQVLRAVSITPPDLSAVAVSIGPGSFTGLRVGLAAAKTVGLKLGIPVLAVSSLQVLAMNAGSVQHPVGAILDARKGQIYGAWFRVGDSRNERLSADAVMTIEAFLAACPEESGLLVGEGVTPYRDRIDSAGSGFVILAESHPYPLPEFTGRLALRGHGTEYRSEQIHQLVPVYLRRSEAEENWEKKFGFDTQSTS